MNTYIIPILLLVILLALFTNKNSYDQDKNIRKLTRQTARWLIAAEQDKSPMIAILHVQYGIGYLWALKDICLPKDFTKATGLKLSEFEEKALKIQDKITRSMVKVCPQFTGDIDRYFGIIAGNI